MKYFNKPVLVFLYVSLSVFLLFGCTNSNKPSNQIKEADKNSINKLTVAPVKEDADKSDDKLKPIKVGVVLSVGETATKILDGNVMEGLEKVRKDLGIIYKSIRPRNAKDDEKTIDFLASEGNDLVLVTSSLMKDALLKVATKYPKIKFAIIDYDYGDKTPMNVKCVMFKEQESAYLAGALAGLMTKNKVIGFVGGMDIPLINRYKVGFVEGAKLVNPDVTLLSDYAGTDQNAFNNPNRGMEIASGMISKKADIIYQVSGNTGQGVFDQVDKSGILAIGSNVNQNYIKPGKVVLSTLKNVDVAVGNTVKSVVDGSFTGGTKQLFGLAEDGVGITSLDELMGEELQNVNSQDQFKIKKLKDSIPKDVKNKIEELNKKIISGEIKVSG